MPTASRSITADIGATFVRLVAYMGGLALLAVVAVYFFQVPDGVAAVEPSPRPAWITVERPLPAFELRMPELSAIAFSYAIQRRPSDGARRDVLTWGEPAASGPYVMVEIERPGAAGERFLDASSEVAARILDFTITDDVKPAGQIDSKFGPVPLVDFAVAPHDQASQRQRQLSQHQAAHAHERRCLGFARVFDRPAMQLAGWYCSAGREVVDRATLGCVLDRLTVISAEPELGGLFARAELKRTFCGQRNPILAATPEHAQSIGPAQNARLNTMLRGPISRR